MSSRAPAPAAATAALIATDRRHLWRPYTSSEDHERIDPIHVVEAEGVTLVAADGERYLDATGAWWCNNLGFRHPRLIEALRRQAEVLPHCSIAGNTHDPAVRLAEELVAVAPAGDGGSAQKLTRVFYSDNGSTSVEVALKMAFQYWAQSGRPERRRFLSLPGAYHGDTIGVMSVSSVDEFSGIFRPLLFGDRAGAWLGEESAAPQDDADWSALFARLYDYIESNRDEIAGVIVEPLVQGASGMRMYPPALLRELRSVCDAHDVFLIADEVFTGFGRTGRFWASDYAGVVPDLLCTAKGLSGGMIPFSATLATERIYDGFRGDKTRALMHGHTFCANPLGAAVALEVLAIYREEDTIGRAAPLAARLAERVHALGDLPRVRRTRALGMVAALDLGEAGYHGGLGWRITAAARNRGVALRPLGNTVYVVPPLTIESDDLEALLDGIQYGVESIG